MRIIDFIEKCKKLDSPIGDLANDIARDRGFPVEKSDEEILGYLDMKTSFGGTNDAFVSFFQAYKKVKPSINYEPIEDKE